ncbi:MAG: preprotein translocase subunit YajC [Oscillospiraceae bacterium]|nr:preprotein translocase subunit YajC [Oscillospiraceae bacterium]
MRKKLEKLFGLLSVAAVCLAFAGCTTTGDSTGSTGSAYSSIIMIVVLIAVFYFFMIRPEQKKKKKTEEMRSSLAVGSKITTIGGMVGKIVAIDGDLITFETGEDRVRIQVTKWAISTNDIQKTEEKK